MRVLEGVLHTLDFLLPGHLSYLINCEHFFSMLSELQETTLNVSSNCYAILEIRESNNFFKMVHLGRDSELELLQGEEHFLNN